MIEQSRFYLIEDQAGKEVARLERVNALVVRGAANGLTWQGGVPPFAIYARDSDAAPFGFIAVTHCNGFADNNIVPDTAIGPTNS